MPFAQARSKGEGLQGILFSVTSTHGREVSHSPPLYRGSVWSSALPLCMCTHYSWEG